MRAAQFGKQAMHVARPRGSFALFRSRASLSLMLYIASRERRLVWHDSDGFALIEPPRSGKRRLIGGRWWLTPLRLVDRSWEALPFVVPAGLLIIMAAATIPYPSLRLLTGLLVLAALGYVGVMMLVLLVWSGYWFYRVSSRRRRIDQFAEESLPHDHWHLLLCHQTNDDRGEELLRETSGRLVRLVEQLVNAATPDLGASVDTVKVHETLVCLVGGATTQSMRDAIGAHAGISHPYGRNANVVIMTAPHKAEAKPHGRPDRGLFLFWYLVGLAFVIVVMADPVAGNEREACAASDCAGRPATFWAAVRWLVGELTFYFGASDLAPATTYAWFLGRLMRINGVIGLLVVVVAGRRIARRIGEAPQKFKEETNIVPPRILILVVKANERDAVMAAVRAVNGTRPHGVQYDKDVVWQLGRLAGADVMLAQCPQAGGAGPNGMTLFASRVLRSCDPDYVILTGICYGLWEERQQIGDIVVSQRLENIDPVLRLKSRKIAMGHRVPASGRLLSLFMAATVDWQKPRVFFGLMLGSDSVYDSMAHRERLKREHPDAVGGEMETVGVYSAAAEHGRDWVAVKAISDWGMDMTDEHQDRAACNAARFVVHTIQRGGFDNAGRGREPR